MFEFNLALIGSGLFVNFNSNSNLCVICRILRVSEVC